MPAYQEGGWGVVAFVPLSFVSLVPRCLLLLMPVSSSIVDMEVHAPGQILASYTRGR